MNEKYDVIIVGAACAGLSAGLYTGRRALKTLIISKDIGGQAAITTEIENYPGTGALTGPALMTKFREQAEKAGAKIKLGEVTAIEKVDGGYLVRSSVGEFETLAVILGFGLTHRRLDVPGEKELAGRGVTYCATCDGPLFKNKTVAVVGGGNSAFDAADYLASICKKVYLLVRSDKYRAEQVLIDAVKAKENVEIKNFTEIQSLIGANRLEKAVLINNQTQVQSDLPLDGVFVEIGWETKTDFLKSLVSLNERGYIIVDKESKTSAEGIFAAGDVTDTPFKQAVISAGDGAKAALSAAKYVSAVKGGNAGTGPDLSGRKWG